YSLAPQLLPPGTQLERTKFRIAPLGGWGDLKEQVGVEEKRHCVETTRAGYYPALQKLQICSMSENAMHELLKLCRRENIQVILLLTPEAKEFQNWYSPAARAAVDRYAAGLADQYRVPLIDARDWLEEADFLDHHHVLLRGAERFTTRLGREVLQPWVAGT